MRVAAEAASLSGRVLDLTREEYDALPGHNFSRIKVIGQSPAHYLHNLLHKQQDKDAWRIGRVTHLMTYEPETVSARVAVWDGGKRQGKLWDAFKAKHAEREIVKEEEYALCLAMGSAVRARAARYVTGGKAEQSVLWTDAALSVDCKARLDFIADVGAIVDLKSTRNASIEGFNAEAWRYGYHVQGAFYVDGYERATGIRLPYILVTVEKDAPHVVQVRPIGEDMLQLGRVEYRRLLGMVVDCQRDSKWPGYATGDIPLEPPRWANAYNYDNEDISELDLIVSQ